MAMLVLMGVCVAGLVLAVSGAPGKDKKKSSLPEMVLNAQTVAVLIDPQAATPMNDVSGNKTAQDDVEKKLMEWGGCA